MVNPTEVEVGQDVTLTSVGFACDGRYDSGANYEVVLGSVGRSETIELGEVDVAEDGSFSASLNIPDSAPVGPAFLRAYGSPHDDCPDNASCAGYVVDLTLRAPAP